MSKFYYNATTSFNWWLFAYFVSGAGAGAASPAGCLLSADLLPKIFLNGHCPPSHPQPARNKPITASTNVVKIIFLRFILAAPFV
jgi:hypothetical protein